MFSRHTHMRAVAVNPDAFYVVDLERHEERCVCPAGCVCLRCCPVTRASGCRYVAIMLVELAVAEPGENWEGETFNGISGWELPMSWTKEVPLYVHRRPRVPAHSHTYCPVCPPTLTPIALPRSKGNLTLEYTTTGPGCAPDWDCRKRLLEFFLCGRRG